ncbi:hypothetical protein [Aquirhabdus sp.]|uniref:hypothetical protein n=1 Tax=Aquirhabdus sp. TaxID=2824160 RepID=UPI00396CECD2
MPVIKNKQTFDDAILMRKMGLTHEQIKTKLGVSLGWCNDHLKDVEDVVKQTKIAVSEICNLALRPEGIIFKEFLNVFIRHDLDEKHGVERPTNYERYKHIRDLMRKNKNPAYLFRKPYVSPSEPYLSVFKLEELARQIALKIQSDVTDLKNSLPDEDFSEASVKGIAADLLILVEAKVLGYATPYQKAQQLRKQLKETAEKLSHRVQPSQREIDFQHNPVKEDDIGVPKYAIPSKSFMAGFQPMVIS